MRELDELDWMEAGEWLAEHREELAACLDCPGCGDCIAEARIGQLEKRLAKLEAMIGANEWE